ncbi:MAG: hypothetical protein ACLGGZ_08060 [Alphaproteobacteria bacterium]|jgi:hypothetical protein
MTLGLVIFFIVIASRVSGAAIQSGTEIPVILTLDCFALAAQALAQRVATA